MVFLHLAEKVFDDDPLCKNNDDQSTLLETKTNKSLELDDIHYHTSQSKSDSQTKDYKPRSAKFQSFNKFAELIDLFATDNDTVHDSLTSLANQSNFFMQFNQLQTSNTIIRTKYDQQTLVRTSFCLFIPSSSSPDKQTFSVKLMGVEMLIEIEPFSKKDAHRKLMETSIVFFFFFIIIYIPCILLLRLCCFF